MKEMNRALHLILCLVLIIRIVDGKQEVLTAPIKLQIQHDFVSTELSQRLYLDLLKVIVPGPRDTMHKRLIEINGDAGARKDMTASEKAIRFREIIEEDSQEKESGILYIEKLKKVDMNVANELINNVVNNKVLDDEGTIHLYLSRPQSAALANHTDTTDIFVLQLHGAKEWILCDDPGHLTMIKSLRGKLDGCSTYNEVEMDGLKCRREILHPGDALYLPKRVVHSARATNEGLSAHLTFGFADNMCLEDMRGCFDPATESEVFMSQRSRRLSCPSSSSGGISCDQDCDRSCDSYSLASCDSSCDHSCDSCSSSSSSSASTSKKGLSGGQIAGIVIGVLVSVVAVGGGVFFIMRTRSVHTSQKIVEPTNQAEPADTIVVPREIQDDTPEVQNKAQPPSDEKTIIKYKADGSVEVTKETKSSDGSLTKEIKMFPDSETAKKHGY